MQGSPSPMRSPGGRMRSSVDLRAAGGQASTVTFCAALLFTTAIGAMLGAGFMLTYTWEGGIESAMPALRVGTFGESVRSGRSWAAGGGGGGGSAAAAAVADGAGIAGFADGYEDVLPPAPADVPSDDEGGAAAARAATAPSGGDRWLQAPVGRLDQLRDDPSTRQQYWWGCLDSAAAAECRPAAAARAKALPFPEWRAHVQALLAATARFRGLPVHAYFNPKYNSSRYEGPWVENHWLKFFLGGGAWEGMYPLVPLFVQWTDALHGPARPGLYDEAVATLFGDAAKGTKGLLRDDVLYVTLWQLDRLPPARVPPCAAVRNVVVISAAGGWGNVAVPLLKGENPPIHTNMWPPTKDPVHNWPRKSVLNTIIDVGRHDRGALLGKALGDALPKDLVSTWPFDIWQWVTHSALYAQTPWGHDRAGFRFYENLRYGRVTLHTYRDSPWLPYGHPADFAPPGSLDARLAPGGEHDVTAYGAVVQPADGGGPTDGAGEPANDPALWEGPLNGGGLWGPGGYGFAVHVDQLQSFLCVACEFVKPGSAARWRRVRTLPLHRYGKAAGQACPCTQQGWADALAPLGSPKNWTVPADSLLYEMERRLLASADAWFSYRAVNTHLESLFFNPATAALKCVPRAATFHPASPPAAAPPKL